MVKLRLARQGRKKLPIYKIVAADSRFPRDGRFVEALGQYRPENDTNKLIDLNEERIMYWLKVGAQPTDTVRSLLSNEGILLKWHLEKKNIEPARASEIFTKWKTDKDAAVNSKIANRENVARKKKEAEAKAKADAAAEAQAAEDAKTAAAAAEAQAAEDAKASAAAAEAKVAEDATAAAAVEAEAAANTPAEPVAEAPVAEAPAAEVPTAEAPAAEAAAE